MNPLEAALLSLPEHTGRLVVGFSGGRDSSVLLDMLATARGVPVPVVALHVCHHLDPKAEDWAGFCRQRCRALGVAFVRRDVAVEPADGGLEAAARQARYEAVARYLATDDVFVTAHHAEDQAETVLIQALRGSGLRGLAAMPVEAPLGAGRLWRPWLAIERKAIAARAAAQAVPWIEDPSNDDLQRDRGYLSARVMPALEQRWPAHGRALARVAQRAAEAHEAVETLAAIDLDAVRDPQYPDTLNISELAVRPPARRGEVLRRWLAENTAATPDHRHLDEIDRLLTAREHNSPRVGYAGMEVRRFDGRLFVMQTLTAPPDPAQRLAWPRPQTIHLPGDAGVLCLDGPVADTGWPDGLSIGFRRGGERIAAGVQTRRLKDLLQSARVPPWVRERMPLIYVGPQLVAIADRWLSPAWHDLFPGLQVRPVWHHELPGDPVRVVARPPLG